MIALTSLTEGQLIVARVRARNINGWEAYSQQNIVGALIETEPKTMNIGFNPFLSSVTTVVITWTALEITNIGGSPVTSYSIQYQVYGSGAWNQLQVGFQLLTYTVTGLTGGLNYDFKIQAFNKYGPGLFSPTI